METHLIVVNKDVDEKYARHLVLAVAVAKSASFPFTAKLTTPKQCQIITLEKKPPHLRGGLQTKLQTNL